MEIVGTFVSMLNVNFFGFVTGNSTITDQNCLTDSIFLNFQKFLKIILSPIIFLMISWFRMKVDVGGQSILLVAIFRLLFFASGYTWSKAMLTI